MHIIKILVIIALAVGGIWAFLKATKKPYINPLPAEYAHTVPFGAVDPKNPKTYTLSIPQKDTYEIVYIPGNASLGAYTAGMAESLQKQQQFHTIVGFSSGGLITLLLYADKPDLLQSTIINMNTNRIMTLKNKVMSWMFGYSFASNAPLHTYLSEVITDEIIDSLQSRYMSGHRAYILSTNLDTSQPTFWDIGAIASLNVSYQEKREKLVSVLVASTALPTIFKPSIIPIDINGKTYTQTHVDGILGAHTPLKDWMLPENIEQFKHKRLTILQTNIYYDMAPVKGTELKMANIAIKSLSDTYRTIFKGSLNTGYIFAKKHNITTRINKIPNNTILKDNALDFSTQNLNTYFDAGKKSVVDGTIQWSDVYTFINENL